MSLLRLLNMNSDNVRWACKALKWTPSRSDMLLASSCVQSEEKERLSRFVFKKDVNYSLVGRLMIRQFIHSVTGKKYDEIKIARDARGKPEYLDDGELNFNVSHQGDYTVFVGVKGKTMLGVDVMKLEYTGGKSLDEYFRVMTRQFSREEWITIRNAGGKREQIAMFYRHWCLKESYVKALGVGITVNLQEISFKINTKNLSVNSIVTDTELYVKGIKQNWLFHESLLDDDHCVAVAFNDISIEEIPFKEIEIGGIMQNVVPLTRQDEKFVDDYFAKLDKD